MSDHLNTTTSDAETIAHLAADTVARSQIKFPDTTDDGGALIVHQTVYRDRDGAEQIDFSTHEYTLQGPYRLRGTTQVAHVDSLVKLENLTVDNPSAAATFLDRERRTITTVANYLGWGDHRIAYQAEYSPDFAKWLKHDNEWLTQTAFAELLQDLRHTIIRPDAADVMQIARTFTATKTAEFESGVHTQSGDVQLSYVENTQARSGGTIEIPEIITIRVAPYRDSLELVDIDLDFRFDAGKNGLRLGYRILRRDEVLEHSWETITAHATENLRSETFVGPAPYPITPLD